MAHIAIFNPVFRRGGSDAVMMAAAEALEANHDVEILCFNRPDIDELNRYFGMSVEGASLVPLGLPARTATKVMDFTKQYTGKWFGSFHISILRKNLSREFSGFDLVVSSGEIPTNHESIQYVHYPRFYTHRVTGSTVEAIYQKACRIAGQYDRSLVGSGKFITNSKWTKNIVDNLYDVESEVIYPPIKTNKIKGKKWKNKEDGFVCVGRIEESKNTHKIIDIINEVVDSGVNTHLHIIGPHNNDKYFKRIQNKSSTKPHIHLDGVLSRDRLLEMLEQHKYGIHGKPREHFGIVVAEMVAAGTIPVVPDSGGQTEIVKNIDSLTYKTTEQAIGNIKSLLTSSEMQKIIIDKLHGSEHRFSLDKFAREISTKVDNQINRS